MRIEKVWKFITEHTDTVYRTVSVLALRKPR